VVVPFAALGSALPEAAWFAVLACGGVALGAVVDAVLSAGRLERVEVVLPELVRFALQQKGVLEVRLRHRPGAESHLRLGLVLPEELGGGEADRRTRLPADADWARLDWACTPRRRGRFRLRECVVETPSAWGLWDVRQPRPVDCEVRVYPSLAGERRQVAALFLNRGGYGVHAVRQVGKGREFEKLRDYVPGDGYDEIHWKAMAKRGRPVTKVFQIERTQEVYVVVDASRLSARPVTAAAPAEAGGEGAETILERCLAAALVLGLAAEQQGDLFGLVTFTDRVEQFVRARNGKVHYGLCRDALYRLQPRPVAPDYHELCSFLRLRLRRRALLVFLTSLDDPLVAEHFLAGLELVRRQHLVLVNMRQPPEARPLFSGAAPASVDDLYRVLAGHHQWRRLRELGMALERRGVRVAPWEDDRLSAHVVTQYLEVKRRQLL
jgi:uncharacterized protein (DUF58 family)